MGCKAMNQKKNNKKTTKKNSVHDRNNSNSASPQIDKSITTLGVPDIYDTNATASGIVHFVGEVF